jgi:hypothetical protein
MDSPTGAHHNYTLVFLYKRIVSSQLNVYIPAYSVTLTMNPAIASLNFRHYKKLLHHVTFSMSRKLLGVSCHLKKYTGGFSNIWRVGVHDT